MAACEIRWPWTTRSPWLSNVAGAQVPLEHRCLGLLRLQHERVPPAATDEQDDPGPRPDAADPDDLPCHVDELVGAEQVAAVLVEPRGVLGQELADVLLLEVGTPLVEQVAERDQQRRDAAEAQLAVHPLGEPVDRPQARLAPRLGERLREHDPALRAQSPAEAVDELARVEPVVPDLQVALLGEAAHPLAILADARPHHPPPAIRGQTDVATGDLDAGRHPLDVPLPRAGQRLVEVVGPEDEPAVRNREARRSWRCVRRRTPAPRCRSPGSPRGRPP